MHLTKKRMTILPDEEFCIGERMRKTTIKPHVENQMIVKRKTTVKPVDFLSSDMRRKTTVKPECMEMNIM
jgi:hypothetical protein